jgi:outer membrane protein assembly factor BamB
MKKLLIVLAVFVGSTTVLSQQGPVRIQTTPQLPLRETLERLDLTMAWTNKVPVDGFHDGFYSLQLFPGKDFTLLVAQTYKGTVVAINAETGDILWRTPVGLPYRPMRPVGANEQAIFACRHETLFVLDRDNGKHLLYTNDPNTKTPEYGQRLDGPPTAGLAADSSFLFACTVDHLVRYAVPDFRALAKLPPPAVEPGGKPGGSPKLIRTWGLSTPGSLRQPPVLTRESVATATDTGNVSFVKKSNPGDEDKAILYWQFQTEGAVAAPLASHRSIVYVPCQDYFLYALDAPASRLLWRFSGQAPIVEAPQVTDADVFVAVTKNGLYRLQRADGKAWWSNRDAVKFLATNERFVYALDRFGKMLVLDYERGKALAAWDARDWVLPIPNVRTDRIYLASNDGQILCLRHRDRVEPLRMRTPDTLPPPTKTKDGKKKDEDKMPPGEDKLPKDKVNG